MPTYTDLAAVSKYTHFFLWNCPHIKIIPEQYDIEANNPTIWKSIENKHLVQTNNIVRTVK
jgi:hypothetical protein